VRIELERKEREEERRRVSGERVWYRESFTYMLLKKKVVGYSYVMKKFSNT
jgi:hypothetical protein